MRVLVVGGAGYVGSVVVERLVERGHQVDAPSGAQLDLADPEQLRLAVTDDIDAVVNVGPAISRDVDLAAADALLDAGKKLVYTSGTWVLGACGPEPAGTDAPLDPIEIVAWRGEVEQRVLSGGGSVIRLGMVHGRGGGIPSLLVAQAAQHGGGRFVGAASARTPMVHLDDAADLFALVVEKAASGTLWHAVAEEGVLMRELARAAGSVAGVESATAWSVKEASDVFGLLFAEALALNHVVSGRKARTELGWRPTRPGAVEDIRSGSYAMPTNHAA